MADALRKMKSSLGERAVLVWVCVMDRKRVVPTNDAPLGTLFSSDGKRDQLVGTPSKSVQHMRWKSNNLQAR
jgi:hypothetical protein